jgi:hypothetical protein
VITEPTGRSFLSYRRARGEEVALVIASQLERGIPSWQDVHDLGDGPTEHQVRDALRDPETANAVMWLTPEVATSDFIQKIEVPEIVARFERDDIFFDVVVAAGGLDYVEAAKIVEGHTGVQNLASWNILKLAADPVGMAEAREVSTRVLDQRLRAIDRQLPAGVPVQLRLFVRRPAPFQPGPALSIDWNHLFDERHLAEPLWKERLLPALGDVAAAVEKRFPGRVIVASGLPTISAAAALGVEFLATRRLDITWQQFTPARGDQAWSINTEREPCGFETRLDYGAVDSNELAVLVSVNENVVNAFAASQANLPPLRAALTVLKPGNPPHDIPTPGEAADLAFLVRDAIRSARQDLRIIGGVHFFMAVPVGLAMMIGQLLNTLGTALFYEHVPGDGIGTYQREVELHPSVAKR